MLARIAAMTVGATFLACLLTSCYDPSIDNKVASFYAECEGLGGEVQYTVPPGILGGGRIDCIVNNEIVYLKGYN